MKQTGSSMNEHTTKQKYDLLYKKTMAGMNWLDNKDRTDAEREKWQPRIRAMFDEITRLEMERRMNFK